MDVKTRHWKEWAIDGMPKDKQRLAEATWQAAVEANRVAVDDAMVRGFRNRLISEISEKYRSQGNEYEFARAKAEADVNEYEDALTAALAKE